jgi:hypothetical protein
MANFLKRSLMDSGPGTHFAHGDHQRLNSRPGLGTRSPRVGLRLDGKAGHPVQVTIKFKSPASNNNGDAPVVDHIDLIAGEITGKIAPGSPDYTKATNETPK